jgi:DNA-binding IclR family transcriptional regulator
MTRKDETAAPPAPASELERLLIHSGDPFTNERIRALFAISSQPGVASATLSEQLGVELDELPQLTSELRRFGLVRSLRLSDGVRWQLTPRGLEFLARRQAA